MYDKSAESAEDIFSSLLKTIQTVIDDKEGCPWLIEHKSHEALSSYIIEEAYEAVEAIENKKSHEILDELGDVLLQVLLHSQIASEKGDFSIVDVMKNLSKKVIRRHPHVFEEGSSKLDKKTIVKQWDAIKKKEKDSSEEKKSWEEKITKHYPATVQAGKIGKSARAINFDWDTPEQVLEKLKSEVKEIEESLIEDTKTKEFSHTKEEIGDLYFTLAQLCRHLDTDPEVLAFSGNLKFCKRVDAMHRIAGVSSLKGKTKKELEELWNKVKAL